MTQQELTNTWLPTVTYEQFLKFEPCWLYDKRKSTRLKKIGSRKREWNALDVLRLEEVTIEDRMWAVLREEFLPAHLLHEYACRCADYVLSKIDNPDPRSVNAIKAKRKWLRGEISNKELTTARNEAWAVAWNEALGVALDATWVSARDAAWNAALDVALDAALAVARAVALDAARAATWVSAWKDLLNILINLIKEAARDAGASTSGTQDNTSAIVTEREGKINGLQR